MCIKLIIYECFSFLLLIQLAVAISTGNGGNSLAFNGVNQNARMRTPELTFGLTGSFTYSCFMTTPADIPNHLVLGAVGSHFGFYESTDATRLISMFIYSDITINFLDDIFYDVLPLKNNEWAHYAFTWEYNSGTSKVEFQVTLNGGKVDEVIYNFESSLFSSPMVGYYDLGKASKYDNVLGAHGRFDNFCHWNRILSSEEIAKVREFGCDSIDSADLVFHYDFEEFRDETPQIKEKVSDSFVGTIRDESVCPMFGDSVFPIVTPFSSPISATGYQTHRIIPNSGVQSEITLDIVGTNSFKLLPDDLTILGLGSLTVGGNPVTAGVVQTDRTIVFTPNADLTVSSISFMIRAIATDGSGDEVDGVVALFPTIKPQCEDFSWSLDESTTSMLYVNKENVVSKEDGDIYEIHLTSLPILEGLEVRSAPTEVTDIWDSCSPITLTSGDLFKLPHMRLATRHDGILSSSLITTFGYKMYDGFLYSDECSIELTVNAIPKQPIPQNSTVEFDEDTSKIVKADYIEHDGEAVIATITKFPTHGTLYQHDSDIQVKEQFSSVILTQWADSATGSSYWPAEGYDFSKAVGPADVYPSHGDVKNVWWPSMSGNWWESQYLEIGLKEPVMITGISLYECWHPGSLVLIQAMDPEGEWETIWKGDWQLPTLNPNPIETQSLISSYVICPKHFTSNKIRFNFEMTQDYWIGIDAVQVTGLKEVQMNVITNKDMQFRYEPDEHRNGVETIEYVVNDCQYYQEYRDLKPEDRTGSITMNVLSVNDAPVAKDATISVEDEDAEAVLTLIAEDPDETTTSALQFQITELPTYGTLFSGGKIVEIGTDVSPEVHFVPFLCEFGGDILEDSFVFSVSDSDYASSLGVIEVNIECQDKPFEMSSGVLVAYWLIASLLVIQSVFLIVSFTKHKRNIVVRLASYRFSVTGLIFSASGFIYGALFTSQKEWACQLRGLALLFTMGGYCGMLYFKSLRISKLVNNKKFKKIRVTDRALFLKFFVPMFLVVIALGSIISFLGTDCDLNMDSSAEEGYLITHCKYKDWALRLIVSVWICGFAALAWISWKVRHAPMELNDANHITVTVFILVMFFLFKFPMAFIDLDSPTVNLIIDGIAFTVVLIICNLVLFTAKIVHIRQMDTQFSSASGASHPSITQTTTVMQTVGDTDDQEIARYRQAVKKTSIGSIPNMPSPNKVHPSATNKSRISSVQSSCSVSSKYSTSTTNSSYANNTSNGGGGGKKNRVRVLSTRNDKNVTVVSQGNVISPKSINPIFSTKNGTSSVGAFSVNAAGNRTAL